MEKLDAAENRKILLFALNSVYDTDDSNYDDADRNDTADDAPDYGSSTGSIVVCKEAVLECRREDSADNRVKNEIYDREAKAECSKCKALLYVVLAVF